MKNNPTIPEHAWPRIEDAIVGAFQKALGRLPDSIALVKLENDQDGTRSCALCGTPLATEVLIAQAEKLLEPFGGMKLERATKDQLAEIAQILERAAGPFNAGLDCCYSCAYGLHQSVTLELVQ